VEEVIDQKIIAKPATTMSHAAPLEKLKDIKKYVRTKLWRERPGPGSKLLYLWNDFI
jgi:hypothetical protein